MRIVGGKFRGRRLAAPSTDKIRPTTDRTRESLFNILTNLISFEGKKVIDLFAGTGALGLEAVSRGCDYVLFVEESTEGRGLLRTNIEALGLQGNSRIFKRDATKIGPTDGKQIFDIAFLDPPYGKQLGERAIEALISGNWLSEGAMVILEERANALPNEIKGLKVLDRRSFGDTAILISEFRN